MLDSVPAVRRLEANRPDCAAFEIVGHVSAADVENLFGLLEGAYALNDEIDVLVRLVDHDGIDWSEVSEETIAEGKRRAQRHVRRCATVGEPNWIPFVQGLFTRPDVELRHFSAEAEGDAWTWIGAAPAG